MVFAQTLGQATRDGTTAPRRFEVLAFDFALLEDIAKPHFEDIAQAYHERAEIYARYIRGESDSERMKREEHANEKGKNELYQARFDAYSRTGKARARVAELEQIAKRLGNMVIGHSKMLAHE